MSDNTRGLLWALLAVALFATAVALAKVAAVHYHVLQILFFRQVTVLLSSLPEVAKFYPQGLRTKRPGAHFVRLAGAFVAMSCGIWAVTVLPLTTAVTLGFTQVFFTTLLAFLLLREPVGPYRLSAVIVGFIGVLVVMRPGVNGLLDWHVLIPVVGAMGGGVAVTSVRRLAGTETTATLLFYQSLFVGLLSGVPLLWLWTTPDLEGWILLLSMGVIATAGQWFGVRSLRLGEASVIGNMEYTRLIHATILGYFLFAEVPDIWTIAGATLIVGSSAFVFHRENAARKRSLTT